MEKICQTCKKCYITDCCKSKYCSRKCIPKESMILNLGKWITGKKTSERNKELWFRKKVSEGLKKHFKKHPRKFEKWYINKYGKNYMPSKLKHCSEWKNTSKKLRGKIPHCERCGKNVNDVHHIIPYPISKNNHVTNLLILCRKCHKIIEDTSWNVKNLGLNWDEVIILIKSSLAENKNYFINRETKRGLECNMT